MSLAYIVNEDTDDEISNYGLTHVLIVKTRKFVEASAASHHTLKKL